MLQQIGVASIENLFDSIPENLRLRDHLKVPAAMSELELLNRFDELAARNQAAHVILFQGQRLRDFTIRKSLLTQQQTTAHRLFDFIQRPPRGFQLLRVVWFEVCHDDVTGCFLISRIARRRAGCEHSSYAAPNFRRALRQ